MCEPRSRGHRATTTDRVYCTELQLEALSEDVNCRVHLLRDLDGLRPPLSREQMRGLAEQARTLLTRFYVHLPTKRALYAADPAAQLTVLLDRLADLPPGARIREREEEFHQELTTIFTSLRDRHTVYILPDPYRRAIAFLPFVVERCWEEGAGGDAPPVYLVTKVHPAFAGDEFPDPRDRGLDREAPSVEVTHFNGVRIDRAVAANGQVNAGGNADARAARGLARLTFRWMGLGSRPLEDRVTLDYRVDGGEPRQKTFPWLYVAREPAQPTGPTRTRRPQHAGARAIDGEGEWIRAVKRDLFAGPRARPLHYREVGSDEVYGYLRIHSFDVDHDGLEDYLSAAAAGIRRAPAAGLIIDIRANPGGSIVAAERLLQMLSPEPIIPERLQFLNTPEVAAMGRRYFERLVAQETPAPGEATFERLSREASHAGAQYIFSPPTEGDRGPDLGTGLYDGPKVLIVDALTYSAGDIFAAGFQDQELGTVIGTDARTGGGGGNVWEYDFVRDYAPSHLLDPLPRNASFDVAVRRATRVGVNGGTAIEDVGVSVDADLRADPPAPLRHRLKRRDVLGETNAALIEYAVGVLART